MTATKTDPHQAWVTAPRDQELERFRVYYAARFPAPRTEDEQEKTR